MQQMPYDIILMDCQMPEMDGYEATRAIRTAEGATQRHIPIIAMTAGALKRDLDACIEAGMDDYITKPVIVETLRTVLDRWLVPAPMRDTSAPD
jgi:CheY-like chemotaxis protein